MTDEHTPAPAEEKRSLRPATVVKLILAVLVIVVIAIFAGQNSERTELEFLGWSFRSPLIIMILGAALAGIVVWEAFLALNRRTRRRGGDAE